MSSDSPFITASMIEKAAMPRVATPKAAAVLVVGAGECMVRRHCEERSGEAIHPQREIWLDERFLFGGVGKGLGRGFELGGLGFDEADDVVDHFLVPNMMVGDSGEVDHVLALAAAGDADVGLARLAGAVDDAAEHAERHRRADVA